MKIIIAGIRRREGRCCLTKYYDDDHSQTKARMWRSRVAAILRAGQVACCTKVNSTDPRVVEIAAQCGVDSVWLCREHGPITLHDIENQIRAAKMFDFDMIVRVPRGSYSDLIYPLEINATGIMVPHVMGSDEASHIARHTRFHPLGHRPLDGGNADSVYTAIT